MDWAEKPHPVELLADWGAPLLLAAAAGWAAHMASLPLIALAAGPAVGLASGLLAMRFAGSAPNRVEPGFEPAPLECPGDLGELSLDDPSVELLLDDPLVDADPGSRVVQLFARPEPTPGELVLRISDYLSEQGKPAADASAIEQQVDASAALHVALANIRANLR